MHRRTPMFPACLVLALGVFVASCQAGDNPTEPRVAEPTIMEPAGTPQPTVVTDALGQTYTLIEGRPLLGWPLQITQLISLSGGQLTLLGHTLTVPRGAVTSPTLFTMLVGLNGYVEVHLEALVPSLFGLLNIGGRGFREPVRLTLSYANATNVGDPNDLVIVHLPGWWGYRTAEPLPSTVDTARKTVTAELDHFSRYAMASN